MGYSCVCSDEDTECGGVYVFVDVCYCMSVVVFIENLVLLLALWSIIYEQPSIEDTSLCLIQKHII